MFIREAIVIWLILLLLMGPACRKTTGDLGGFNPEGPALELAVVGGTNWIDNFRQATARADAEKKLVLAFFTGSDFCAPCARLKKEVLDTSEFLDWAEHRFVLLELDYPKSTPQPQELVLQNSELMSRYQVSSFPTVLILSPQGTVLAKAAYQPGGTKRFIERLELQLAALPE